MQPNNIEQTSNILKQWLVSLNWKNSSFIKIITRKSLHEVFIMLNRLCAIILEMRIAETSFSFLYFFVFLTLFI